MQYYTKIDGAVGDAELEPTDERVAVRAGQQNPEKLHHLRTWC